MSDNMEETNKSHNELTIVLEFKQVI